MYYIIEHIRLIIDEYKGDYPLATWLKNYYKAHHQLGSRDRKAISEAVFLYYRFKNRLPVLADSWEAVEQAAFHTEIRSPYLKKVMESHNTGISPVPLLT